MKWENIRFIISIGSLLEFSFIKFKLSSLIRVTLFFMLFMYLMFLFILQTVGQQRYHTNLKWWTVQTLNESQTIVSRTRLNPLTTGSTLLCDVRFLKLCHRHHYACSIERTFFSIFSSNSEANASELLENIFKKNPYW